jgi:RNA polymerase sigma-70 factor, ECF subfamily
VGPHTNDIALVERCGAGAPGAFEELYRAHAPRLFGLASRMVGRQDAEDLLQDIFVTAHRKLGHYRGDSALGTWLFRVGANICADHLRSRASRFTAMSDHIDGDLPDDTGSGPILGVVDRLDLERALAVLPANLRMVFVLHDVEGLGHREIGEIGGFAEGTSKSHLHRARLRLREELRPRAAATGTR